ncbi:uncharacterized protein BDR25DRAFT_316983 [Lindgomyces ingoldianus]|uniref:Uncharacterized protein n=1 Tax=Lindgomyces ingoldianus TaxID=673940 RepID=A0ACB6QK36_9PLEO|nr:uncharacterized protein BDR25DRAFT_316983 [Lindgomyces ingoldianus]KAF2467222.1 hypothetical protein BDR25DRAFT_316983 [Lindgomyces ingoldianus]
MAQTMHLGYPGVTLTQTEGSNWKPRLKFEDATEKSVWAVRQARPNGRSSISIADSNSFTRPNLSQDPHWVGVSPTVRQLGWCEPQYGQWMVPTFEHQLLPKCETTCNAIVTGQDLGVRDDFGHCGDNLGAAYDTTGLSNATKVVGGSDIDTNAEPLSPGSYFSDLPYCGTSLDHEPPDDQLSSRSRWIDDETNTYGVLDRLGSHSIPASIFGIDPMLSQIDQSVAEVNWKTLQQNASRRLQSQLEPSQLWTTSTALSATPELNTIEWAYQPPQSVVTPSQGSGRWSLPQNSPCSSRVTYAQGYDQCGQSSVPGFNNTFSNSTSLGQNGSIVHSTQPGVHAYNDADVRDDSTRFQSSDHQRRMEDDILLRGKRQGLTYREIKKKIPSNVAESTLRGRYRSLTKARKDRVRRPVWTANDVCLLRRIVSVELENFDAACYRELTRSQKLAKISWKRVAEYISTHGGSYHFGNSTCKKKWSEVDTDD